MRITVPIDPETFDRLVNLAESERRRPQDQAAVLLADALTGPRPATPGREPAPAERAR